MPADLASILSRMMAKQPSPTAIGGADPVSDALRESLVKDADPRWPRQNPAPPSGQDVLKRATVHHSRDAQAPPVVSALSAAVSAGLKVGQPKRPFVDVKRAAPRPCEACGRWVRSLAQPRAITNPDPQGQKFRSFDNRRSVG